MATSPMMQGFADSEMPNDAAGPGEEAGEDGQIAELCIGVMQDGTLMVYKETGPETQEQESPRQPAASIGEALKMVLDLYKAMEPGNGDAAFQAGFSADEGQMQRPMGRNMTRGMA
jgi:hypothetical protein